MNHTHETPDWCSCWDTSGPTTDQFQAYFAQRRAEGMGTEPSDFAISLLGMTRDEVNAMWMSKAMAD